MPRVGSLIRILSMEDPYCGDRYNGREGMVTYIDDIGQLHGDWGSVAVIPGVDTYMILDY